MAESGLSPGQTLLQGICDRHFSVVQRYLQGEEVAFSTLWLSVGYFLEGSGKWREPKPWSNEEQLEKLLKATEREE